MSEAGQSAQRSSLRFKDDRGKPTTLLDPYLLHRFRRHDTIEADALADIAGDLGSGLTRLARFFLVVGVLCALIGVIAFAEHLIQALRAGKGIFPLPKLLPLANVWVGPIIIWIGACRLRSRRIRSVMLEHLRCPHCGYDLRLLPVDPVDGATVCPECGCAWKLRDIPAP